MGRAASVTIKGATCGCLAIPGASLAGNTPTGNNFSNNQIAGVPYDASGNQIVVNGNTVGYDAENHQVSVTEPAATGGATESYYFDGNGQRVEKSGPGGTVVYAYDAFGQVLAEYSTATPPSSPCQTSYLSTDHLGSLRLVTGQAGNVVARHDYLPYGEETTVGRNSQWNSSDNVSQKFTGQMRDAETGEDYFNARMFGSALGRFTSPDPGNAGADLYNPQTWNAYSYVVNNPLGHTDPTGMFLSASGNQDGDSSGDDTGEPSDCLVCLWIGYQLGGGLSGGGGVIPFTTMAPGMAYVPPVSNPPTTKLQAPATTGTPAPSNAISPAAQPCQVKIQNAVNNALNTNSTFLGPTSGPGMSPDGYRNGAYNFNYFAPGVVNPVAGSTNGSGRFPGSGLHIPLPGGKDPTISPWGYNAAAGGSYFTAHFDSANPTDDLVSLLIHFFNDVLLRRAHGC